MHWIDARETGGMGKRSLSASCSVLVCVIGLGCNAVSGVDEFAVGIGGASASSTTSSGGGGGGGGGGVGGSGGDGGARAELIDRGLLARYFLDDDTTNGVPPTLTDSAPEPLSLNTAATQGMTLTDTPGRGALNWPAPGFDDRASAPVNGSKLLQLAGLTTGTIELVIEVDGVTSNVSRFIYTGFGAELGDFALGSSDDLRMSFYWGRLAGRWQVDFAAINRVVLHVVLDTSQTAVQDRTRLYVDAMLVPQQTNVTNLLPPQQDETTNLPADLHFALGNREIGGRSIQGSLFYAALYTSALSQDEVQRNTTRLSANDDR
jgi:hypothetical protein